MVSLLFCVLALACCLLLIRPDATTATHGLSYYGTRLRTVVPFAVALLAVATGSWTAASLIAGPRWWAVVLRTEPVLLVIVLIAPYSLSSFTQLVHDLAAGLAFFGSFLIAVTVLVRWRTPTAKAVAAASILGDLLALAGLLGIASALMLIGQLVSLAGFLPLLASLAVDHASDQSDDSG